MDNFRSWTSGNVTLLRAQELWLQGFWELSSLLSQLKADVQGRENGESLLWFIDEQQAVIEKGLIDLTYTTWNDEKAYPANPDGGGYNEAPNAQELFTLYVKAYAREKVDAVRAEIDSGNVDPNKSWTIGSWFVEDEITSLLFELRAIATLYVPEGLVEPATSDARHALEATLRGEIGKGYESGEQWEAFVVSAMETARQAVSSLGIKWIKDGQRGLGSEFEAISDIVERAGPATYDEGVLYSPLALNCSETSAILTALDSMLGDVKPEEVERYRAVYLAIEAYSLLVCVGADAPAKQAPYRSGVSLNDRVYGVLLSTLESKWASEPWVAVHDMAGDKNLSSDLYAMLVVEHDALISQLDVLFDDPWKGPLSRDVNGNVVPYAGIPVGEQMYIGWVNGIVDAAYDRVYWWARNAVEAPASGEYVAASQYIEALLTVFENLWYNDSVRGVRIMSMSRVGKSIVDKHWYEFVTEFTGLEGRRFSTIDSFQQLAVLWFETSVQRARDEEATMRESAVETLPERFVEIESAVALGSGMAPSAATALMMELDEMRVSIPWAEASRYDAVYGQLLGLVRTTVGDPLAVVWRSDSTSFYDDRDAEFVSMTADDEALDAIYNHGYASAAAAWRTDLWSALTALEREEGLSSGDVSRMRAAAVVEAWDNYELWRERMFDAARTYIDSMLGAIERGASITTYFDRLNEIASVNHEYLQPEVARINEVLGKEGVELGGSVAPFARFKPLKSKSGFNVEEYSMAHLEDLLTNWADERLEAGIAVQPKINGYRLTCQIKNGETRMYMEDVTKDFSSTFPGVAAELSGWPDAILDGEMIEIEEGASGDRESLAKYRAVDVDDSNLTIMAFDLLFEDGVSLVDFPYSERRAALERYVGALESTRVELLPEKVVHTREELLEAIEWADKYDTSEGAMMKAIDSPYPLGERTTEWCKAKRTSDLQVRVLGVDTTKADDFVARCGVEYQNEDGVDPAFVEDYGGTKYVVLGTTYRTKLKVKPGDKLEVSVTEVLEQDGARGVQLGWMMPTVKDFSQRPVDTLNYTRQVGKLLQASSDVTWGALDQMEKDALGTTSVDVLRGLEVSAWALLIQLNAARLRNYAWAVIQLIRGRLGKWIDGRVNDDGVVKRYEIGVDPIVTQRMAEEFEAELRGIEETVDESIPVLRQKAENLDTMLQTAIKNATEPAVENRLRLLADKLTAYMDSLPEAGRSLLAIASDLATVESALDDLSRNPSLDAEEVAAEHVRTLMDLSFEIGSSSVGLRARVEKMALMLDQWLHPAMPTEDVRSTIKQIRAKYDEAYALYPTDAKMAEFTISSALLRVDALRRNLEDWQEVLFETELNILVSVMKDLQRFPPVETSGSMTRLRKLNFAGHCAAGYVKGKEAGGVFLHADHSAHVVRVNEWGIGLHASEIRRVLVPGGIVEVAGSVRLDSEGESEANSRNDFMSVKPITIPVSGSVWLHVDGLSEKNAGLSLEKLLASSDPLELHIDLRFEWRDEYLEGMTVALGGTKDIEKWTKYAGGKLRCSLKKQHSPLWVAKSDVDKRVFKPGEVGNSGPAGTYSKIFLLDKVSMVPSRMRAEPKGDKYFEFVLTFGKAKALDGLWGMSEAAAKDAGTSGFFLFKLKTEIPFWQREAERHEEEINELPEWQKTK